MKKLLAIAIVSLCAPFGAHAAEQVVQLFACELQDGKTMENVWALADSFREGMASLESSDEGAGAFLWTSFRGATPYDYIMGFTNSSLVDMTAGLSSYYSSGIGAGLDAQFQATGNCISGIMFSEQIKNGVIGNTGDRQPDAMVEAFGCTLNKGADMDDVEDAAEYFVEQVEDLNSEATNTYEAYLWTPYRGGTGQIDFMWVGNYADPTTWAQGETDYYESKQGQAADARFNKISTCGSSLWTGYWITPPAGGPAAQ
jgi:hypothetical protein